MYAYPDSLGKSRPWWSWLVLVALAVPVACLLFIPSPPGVDRSPACLGSAEGDRALAALPEKRVGGPVPGEESEGTPRMRDYLLPGDILLGRCRLSLVPSTNPPRGWTHAALYVGDGDIVVAANPYQGTVRAPVESWEFPRMTWVVCLRVTSATEEERRMAAELAEGEVGTSYDLNWFSEQEDGETWYCSELPWAVYRRATGGRLNLEVGMGSFGVSPDDLYLHPDTAVIGGHFERRPDTILSLLMKALTLCALFGTAAVMR
ncbi:YiiX/YebB-like N1pC/P60 family cysteine hydrolase [Candidatus Solincola sp.]|nr:YiiX/YebB-like N1pC/P60 family cysteine hydrolase [Actinomycetota bacterium]MDI7251069.1 YiiX/YebB-like N1pC/P60 family cysteine hydrolase [Actinomycetota bacterium]